MEHLYEQIKEEISLIENSYDIIRIVDILNKKSRIIKSNSIENLSTTCYDFWEKGLFCSNCISTRAYYEKDTIVKIVSFRNKIFLITSYPIIIGNSKYVLEMIKDISKNNIPLKDRSINNLNYVIDTMNDCIIHDKLTGTYNKKYVYGRLPIDINTSIINKQPLCVITIIIKSLNSDNSENRNDLNNKTIKNISKILCDSIRDKNDWVARYSNNSFIVVLNNIEKEATLDISKELETLSNSIFSKYKDCINIKISTAFDTYSIEKEKVNINKILADIDKTLTIQNKKSDPITITNNTIEENNNLFDLKTKIEELRSVLNEMCITTDETIDYKQVLETSQYLDTLIVEYMKTIK